MANYQAIVMINGILSRINTPDNLIVGSGLMNVAGNLTITPTGTDLVIAAAKNLSGAAGAGSINFGLMSGTYSAPTGVNTFGGSSNTFSGIINSDGGIDRSTAAALNLGTTTANAVNIGRVGQLTTIAGNLTVAGNEIVTGTTTLSGDVVGNLNFVTATAHALQIEPSLGTTVNGGAFSFLSGAGSAATGGSNGGAGGAQTLASGVGGAAAGGAGVGGAGGAMSVLGGVGGAGTATGLAGAGGAITFAGGSAGSNGGAGGAAGGNLTIDGGAATGAATAGTVSIGTANASSVTIGRAAITTTINGALTQLNGAISMTGNAASSVSTSAGALTLSGFSALNLQGNGTTALQIASGTSIVVQNGATLSTTGTGQINLPSAFLINSVAVSANVTAANLGTLTAGAGSVADALHTHSGIGGGGGTVTGLTTTAMSGGTGQAGYVSANLTVTPTDNLAIASSRFFGFYGGVAGSMTTSGLITAALFTTVGGSPSAGAPVYLAASTDEASAVGKLTATAPSVTGAVVAEVGICLSNANYAGAKTAQVLIQPKQVIQL